MAAESGILSLLSMIWWAGEHDGRVTGKELEPVGYTTLLAAAPFGWIGGWLSSHDRTYPFVLTVALLAVAMVLVITRWVPIRHEVTNS